MDKPPLDCSNLPFARHFGRRDRHEPAEALDAYRAFDLVDFFAVYLFLTMTAFWFIGGQALQRMSAALFVLFLGLLIYSQKSQRFFVFVSLFLAFLLASTVPLSIDDIGYELSARSVAIQGGNVVFLLRRVQTTGIFEFMAVPFLLFDWSKAIRLADPVIGLLISAVHFGGQKRGPLRATLFVSTVATIYALMGEQNAAPFWTPIALLFAIMSDPHRERLSLGVVLVSLLRPNLAPAAIALLAARVAVEPKAWRAFVTPRRTLAVSAIFFSAALMHYSQTGYFWYPLDRRMYTSEFSIHFFSQLAELQTTREILATLGRVLSTSGLMPIVAVSLLVVFHRNWARQGLSALVLPQFVFLAVSGIALITQAPQITRYWFPVLFAFLLHAAHLLASLPAPSKLQGFTSRNSTWLLCFAMFSVMVFVFWRQNEIVEIDESIEVEFEIGGESIDGRPFWSAVLSVYVPGNSGRICFDLEGNMHDSRRQVPEVWSTRFRVRDISAQTRVQHAQSGSLAQDGTWDFDRRLCSSRLRQGVYEVSIDLAPLLRPYSLNSPSGILTISANEYQLGRRSVEFWPKPYTSREYPLLVTDPRYSSSSYNIHISLGRNLAKSIDPTVGSILIAADHAWWVVKSTPALEAVAHRIYFADTPFVVSAPSMASWSEHFDNIAVASQLSLNFPFDFHEARVSDVHGQPRIWSTWYVKARDELDNLESRCETNHHRAANAPSFVQLRCNHVIDLQE